MKKILLYYHGGSKNHGCEAIIRTTKKILSNNSKTVLYSFAMQEDISFKLHEIIEIKQLGTPNLHLKNKKSFSLKNMTKNFIKIFIPHFIFKAKIEKTVKNKFSTLLCDKDSIAISVGGDNYCYNDFESIEIINRLLNGKKLKTVLWGCSIEPDNIKKDIFLKEDLKRYSLITARESLTYKALIDAQINKNTYLIPDSAFILDTILPSDLPKQFYYKNTVGINISPLIQNFEKRENIIYENTVLLVKYIIENTDMNIALIPHVIWDSNNDLEPLTKIYNKFKNTNRICLINSKYNCMELKGIISRCRFLVAARTHASIAGYSSQVPTLVIGYSVKAKGIAKDIFGDYKNYVLPVQDLKNNNEITNAFKFLMDNETAIREHYKFFMPSYIEKVWQTKDLIEKLKD